MNNLRISTNRLCCTTMKGSKTKLCNTNGSFISLTNHFHSQPSSLLTNPNFPRLSSFPPFPRLSSYFVSNQTQGKAKVYSRSASFLSRTCSAHLMTEPNISRRSSSSPLAQPPQVTPKAYSTHVKAKVYSTSSLFSQTCSLMTEPNISRLSPSSRSSQLQVPVKAYSTHAESDEDFDCRFEAYFSRPDIDGWEVRQGINNLMAYDLVPDPRIICAVLKACRRVSDYSLAVRFLEAVKFKCGNLEKTIYPYVLQEIRPTLNELGVDTPEELGYGKPEMYLQSTDDMH